MKCPKCNQEIDDDGAFCEFCGAKIERSTPSHPNETTRIEDRMAEMVRKTVGGAAQKYREGKDKAVINYLIIKERLVTAIKKSIDIVTNKYKEIINKIRNYKK